MGEIAENHSASLGRCVVAKSDTVFSRDIAEFYDRYIGPTFVPWVADIAWRVDGLSSGAVLEVAAGTGMVTEALRERFLSRWPSPRPTSIRG